MLEFLFAEPDQRLERHLVAEPIVTADFQHLGVDEALYQSEYLGIRASLNLADETLFAFGEREEIRSQ